jgi:hypothetical protein
VQVEVFGRKNECDLLGGWRFLFPPKSEMPDDTGICPLGMHPKEPKSICNLHTCTTLLSTVLFTKPKPRKQHPRSSTEEWMEKT